MKTIMEKWSYECANSGTDLLWVFVSVCKYSHLGLLPGWHGASILVNTQIVSVPRRRFTILSPARVRSDISSILFGVATNVHPSPARG